MAGSDEVDLPQLEGDATQGSSPALLTGGASADADIKRSAQDLEAFDIFWKILRENAKQGAVCRCCSSRRGP